VACVNGAFCFPSKVLITCGNGDASAGMLLLAFDGVIPDQ